MVSVQCLRAIAAILVVIYHVFMKAEMLNLTDRQYFEFGGSGVDLFFIISGYIMVYITYGKKVETNEFIKKRFMRIIPLYWFLTSIAATVYFISPSLINSHGAETTVINSYTLFPVPDTQMLISVGWTLRYEFIFYFIFAVALLAGHYRYMLTMAILLLIGALQPVLKGHGFYADFFANAIMVEFAMGMLAFFILKHLQKNLYFALPIGIALMIYFNHNWPGYSLRFIGFGLPMLLIFVGFVSLENAIKRNGGFFKHLSYIGDSSYSLYLSHLFSIALVVQLFKLKIIKEHVPALMLIPVSILASIVFGIACYVIVEKPLTALVKNMGPAFKRRLSLRRE
jgi:exopolysaccharide production protein ExoZ